MSKNGNGMTTRDYVMRTYQSVQDLKDSVKQLWGKFDNHQENCLAKKEIDEHKKTHNWLWVIIIGIPPAIYYLLKLVEGVKK